MVKLRMNTADVAAEVRCLRKLIGMRCANIYDLSPKTYVIKLAKSSGVTESGESEKSLLLLESGVRLHTTEFARDKSTTPSGFTLKLRKHIRTRRLEDIRQLGIDRVVDLQFGLGESTHHIILELYALGNILLTDANYNVLTLLRSHRDDDKGLVMMVKHQYPINSCRLFERNNLEKVEQALRVQKVEVPADVEQDAAKESAAERATPESKKGKGKSDKGVKDKKEKTPWGKKVDSGRTLKSVLADCLGYGPALSEHIILDSGLQSNMKVAVGTDGSLSIRMDDLHILMEAVVRFEDWLDKVVNGGHIPEGYVYMQKKKIGKTKAPTIELQDMEEKIYDEFTPLPMKQFDDRTLMKMDTYDAALDEFFSKIEGQRADQQRKAQEDSAFSKLDRIRADQTYRVETLKQEVDQKVHMAELIEYNLEDVDAALMAVRSILASGMDWKDLARMIKEEKKAGNPVAGLIHSLQLEKNQITLLLSNNLDDMDDDEKTQPVSKVEVDIDLSAHANARHWFEQKKKHAVKQEKTVAAHEKAFKAAEKKTQQQLAQAKSVAAISHLRKVHWFEKFNWFITSENYLVISGRDAQQNELVVKRYMKKGDLYVHAELHGASSTLIKNHNPLHPIPPLTINQAGCFTVCRSQAWDSKIVTSAWWVEPHQVSKTAPTGEYLTVGSFMIRGKKNFLPPNPLVMGFGLLFRLDESSIAAHINERRVRGDGEEEVDRSSREYLDQAEAGFGGDTGLQVEEDMDSITLVTSDKTRSADKNTIAAEDSNVMSTVTEDGEQNGVSDDEGEDREEESLPGLQTQNQEEEIVSSQEDSDDGSSGLDALLDRALELRAAPKRGGSSSKYGLEVLHTESQDTAVDDVPPSESAQRERPYISKAERRKAKKCGKPGVDFLKDEFSTTLEDVEEDTGTAVKERGLNETSSSMRNDKAAEVGEKVGRGRKGKLKKIKGKYAEQDEDERELRRKEVKAAAPAGVSKKDNKSSGKGSSNSGTSTRPSSTGTEEGDGPSLSSKVCYKCKKPGHLARDCPGIEVQPGGTQEDRDSDIKDEPRAGDEEELVEARDPAGKDTGTGDSGGLVKDVHKVDDGLSRRARAKMTEKEIAALLAEENVVELGEDERGEIDRAGLTNRVSDLNDVLLYAVPVCAPYQTLQSYKYRVKLTPGAQKKGKAAKVAVDLFSHMQEVAAREKELMKAVTDPELAACMIGNVKVTAPGLTKMKQTQKKGKKASSKKD